MARRSLPRHARLASSDGPSEPVLVSARGLQHRRHLRARRRPDARPPGARLRRRSAAPSPSSTQRANRVAHALADLGVQPGEHVGIYAQNCAEWIETMLGCFKLRAVPINVNFRYVEDELRYIFDNADLVGVVYDPAVRRPARRHRRRRCRSCGITLAIGDRVRGALAAAVARARLRRALPRRPLHPLHGRHHRHAQGRDVAPGGRVHGARPGHRRHHRPQGRATTTSSPRRAPPTPARVVLLEHAAAHARRRPVGHPRPAGPGQHRRCSCRKFDAEEVWRHRRARRAPTRS